MEAKDLKVGLKVLITKPLDLEEGPGWVPMMDNFDGKTVEIVYISTSGKTFTLREDSYGWCYDPRWATVIRETGTQATPQKTSTDSCPCSARDLLNFGHKCGRKAKIDTWR